MTAPTDPTVLLDPPTPIDLALRYAKLGWRVYPVERGTKKAIYTGWQTSATTDPDVIARSWRREPYPNIGAIAGERFAVFDIEAPHLHAFYEHLERLGVAMPETMVSATGRGGIHVFVRPVPTVRTTRKLRLDGRHIGEFKTTGGIVLPPSVTEQPYRWLWWPDEPEPADAPMSLTALIAEPSAVAHESGKRPRPADPALALDVLARAVRDEPEGNRNGLLFWAAHTAVEEGLRPDVVSQVLKRAALKAGLRSAEIDATIASAFAREGVRP